MRPLWSGIVQPIILPLMRMQEFGIRVDEPRRVKEIEDATKELAELGDTVIGLAGRYGAGSLPALPVYVPCETHPEYAGATRKSKCLNCFSIWGQLREWRESKTVKKAKRLAGFNVGSDDHLRWLLFEALKLKPVEWTDTGKPRVNLKAMEVLIERKTTPNDVVPLLQTLVEIAHLGTLINVFLNPPMGVDGRAHPPLTAEGTSIGRMRSGATAYDEDKPTDAMAFNIQNVPERARHIYIPDEGCGFLEVDASKIEWILMMLDARCVRADTMYRQGVNVHMLNAETIAKELGLEWIGLSDEMKKELYKQGKRCSHMFDYGGQPRKAARTFRLTLERAERIHKAYYALWPEVLRWQEEVEETALRDKQLVNAFGRRRRFLDVTMQMRNGVKTLVLNELNEALAFKPASTNATIWQLRFAELDKKGFRQVTGTHDSHLVQVPLDRMERAVKEVVELCEEEIPELANLVGEKAWKPRYGAKVGMNWGPWHKVRNVDGLKEVTA